MDTNLLQQLLLLSAQKSHGISDASWVLIIAAVTPTLVALAAYLKTRAVSTAVKEVHLSINSRFDEWLKVEREQGVASGRIEERKDAAEALKRSNP